MTATVTELHPDPGVGRDPRIEAWLDGHHVVWGFDAEFDLERIDTAKSLRNQARVDEPLLEDTVELYEQGYRKGDQFPPLLLRRTSPKAKKLLVLGGNHRTTAALRAGINHHPAYVVECTDEAAVVLMYGDNLRNGVQLPRKQRIAQAVHLVELGWTGQAAAAQLGVAASEVSNARTIAGASRRAAGLTAGGQYDQLPTSIQIQLAKVNSDPVFAETTKLVAAAGMGGQTAADFIGRVRKARSDSAALTIIGNELEERRTDIQKRYGGTSSGRQPRVTAYSRVVDAVTKILDAQALQDDVAASCPNDDARRRLKARLRDAGRACMDLEKSL